VGPKQSFARILCCCNSEHEDDWWTHRIAFLCRADVGVTGGTPKTTGGNLSGNRAARLETARPKDGLKTLLWRVFSVRLPAGFSPQGRGCGPPGRSASGRSSGPNALRAGAGPGRHLPDGGNGGRACPGPARPLGHCPDLTRAKSGQTERASHAPTGSSGLHHALEVVFATFGRAALPHWNQVKPSRELQNRASWHSPEAVSGFVRQASVTDLTCAS